MPGVDEAKQEERLGQLEALEAGVRSGAVDVCKVTLDAE